MNFMLLSFKTQKKLGHYVRYIKITSQSFDTITGEIFKFLEPQVRKKLTVKPFSFKGKYT